MHSVSEPAAQPRAQQPIHSTVGHRDYAGSWTVVSVDEPVPQPRARPPIHSTRFHRGYQTNRPCRTRARHDGMRLGASVGVREGMGESMLRGAKKVDSLLDNIIVCVCRTRVGSMPVRCRDKGEASQTATLGRPLPVWRGLCTGVGDGCNRTPRKNVCIQRTTAYP